MLRTNSANRVSVTEQMYAVNRIHGLGDAFDTAAAANPEPITGTAMKVISFFKKVFGTFTKDPYRDVHIPAQNAAVAGFADVLNQIETQRVQGTMTRDALNRAVYAVQTIYTNFRAYTSQLSQQHPGTASRYEAGTNEVVALGKQIVSDLNNKFAGLKTATPSLDDIAGQITGRNAAGQPNVSPVVLAIAAFLIVPKLLKK